MISVVCPFYNEKENLPILYRRLQKVLSEVPDETELIFVNDGSTDDGEQALKALTASDKRVRLLEMKKRYGMTTALYAGLQKAQGEWILTLDADLQNPPEEIPKLLAFYREFDMVTGIREKREDDWLRKISSKIANGIRRMVLGDHISDIGCSLRIFRKELLKCFYPFQGMHRFFPAVVEKDGFRIKQVLVKHGPRQHGLSKFGVSNRAWKGIKDLFAVKWIRSHKIEYQIKDNS